MSRAQDCALSIKQMLERKPRLKMGDEVGLSFAYPSRPNHMVLKRFNLDIRPGDYVAVCGPSGSGKSTIVSLLERFHDPTQGAVLVDNRDIGEINVQHMRKQGLLVSQESTLFNGTIRNNITLGCSWRTVSEKEIRDACAKANILEFIDSLSLLGRDGFDTEVGLGGVMLSGGQHQRISIARALVKEPEILILDEAISALDTETERVVQKAISEAAKNRTTIAIAHRLSTIQHADRIIALDNGEIVEEGSHAEFVKLGGRYADMMRQQSVN
ncbi:multidrug resistance protein 4 [Xylariaceae sp. FL0255]|nr:multidrug resistance protein 4 [Xylariaceae sp. FL0255]